MEQKEDQRFPSLDTLLQSFKGRNFFTHPFLTPNHTKLTSFEPQSSHKHAQPHYHRLELCPGATSHLRSILRLARTHRSAQRAPVATAARATTSSPHRAATVRRSRAKLAENTAKRRNSAPSAPPHARSARSLVAVVAASWWRFADVESYAFLRCFYCFFLKKTFFSVNKINLFVYLLLLLLLLLFRRKKFTNYKKKIKWYSKNTS